jgi:precorrin-3B methylase
VTEIAISTVTEIAISIANAMTAVTPTASEVVAPVMNDRAVLPLRMIGMMTTMIGFNESN